GRYFLAASGMPILGEEVFASMVKSRLASRAAAQSALKAQAQGLWNLGMVMMRGALTPAGFSAAGRSSTDPATARKVEAKKRERREDRRPGREAAGGRTVGHDRACHGHGSAIPADDAADKADRQVPVRCHGRGRATRRCSP